MVERKPSNVVIQPSDRVIETLRLAMAEAGVEELLERTRAPSELLMEWASGEKWVPIDVVREACDINGRNPKAPSHSRILSECTAGASFKIVVDEEANEPAAPIVKRVVPPAPWIPPEEEVKPSPKAFTAKAFRRIATFGIAIFIVPILTIVTGFFFEGSMGAVTGALVGFAIIAVLTLGFFVLLPGKSRKT